MRDLCMQEIEEVAGGNPVVGFGLGVVGGVVGNYIYESVGGATGINNAISGFFNNFSGSYQSGSGMMVGSGMYS